MPEGYLESAPHASMQELGRLTAIATSTQEAVLCPDRDRGPNVRIVVTEECGEPTMACGLHAIELFPSLEADSRIPISRQKSPDEWRAAWGGGSLPKCAASASAASRPEEFLGL